MVDIAKYFLTFSQDESCASAPPAAKGPSACSKFSSASPSGQGRPEDIERLERLAKLMRKASLCVSAADAPNPILSTLTHYRRRVPRRTSSKNAAPPGKCPGLRHGNH